MEDQPRVGRVKRSYRKLKAHAKYRIERIKLAWRRDDGLREEAADTASETAEDALTSYVSRRKSGGSRDNASDGWPSDRDGNGVLETVGHVLYVIFFRWWIGDD